MMIGWNLVSGADSYRIEWETDPKRPEDEPGTGSVTHGETAPLANGILHTYTVVRADGSAVVLSAIPSAASGAPTGVSVTPGPDDNALSWQSVAGATYRVYWSFTAGVTPFNGTRIDAGAATTYLHAGLEAGTDYHYVVTAVSSAGVESAASAEVGGRPGPAGTVSVTAGDRRVTVSWTDAVAPTTITYTKSLALYVGSPFFFPYRIPALENGTRYGIRVTPRFTQGDGRPSTRVYTTPAASVAGVPQGVTITAGGDNNTITWTPVLGAASYVVTWWSLNAGEPSTGSATVTGAAFRHTGLLTCLAAAPTCPAHSYTVAVSGGSTSSTEVGAVSIPFQPFPPLITNATRVILAGLKPAGTSVALNGAEIVPRNRDTEWEYPVTLPSEGFHALAFVAIDDTGRMSAAASYQILRDTLPPAEPANITASCAASTVGPPRATFTGTKELDAAIVSIDAANFERLLVGTDNLPTWTATVDASVGNVAFTFVAKDVAGNASFPPVTATVTCS